MNNVEVAASVAKNPLVVTSPRFIRNLAVGAGYEMIVRGDIEVCGYKEPIYLLINALESTRLITKNNEFAELPNGVIFSNVEESVLRRHVSMFIDTIQLHMTTLFREVNNPSRRTIFELADLILRLSAFVPRTLTEDLEEGEEVDSDDFTVTLVSLVKGDVTEFVESGQQTRSLEELFGDFANLLSEGNNADLLADFSKRGSDSEESDTMFLFFNFALFAYEFLDCTDPNMVTSELVTIFLRSLAESVRVKYVADFSIPE